MIRINLLPHREQKRQAKIRRFAAFLGIFACAGLIMVLLGFLFLQERIQVQTDRNTYLHDEIHRLDLQLEQIADLKKDLEALNKRKDVVQRLQSNRSEVVNVMLALVKQTPTGIYLKEVKQSGASLVLTGFSQSNARVATYMRSLEDSPTFVKPVVLQGVQTVRSNGSQGNLQSFTLTVNIAREATDDDADKSKKHTADKKG